MKGGRFRIGILACIVAVALAVLCAEGAQKRSYRLKLEKGKKYYFRTITKQEISQTVMARQQTAEKTIGMGMDLDVNEVDANGAMLVDYTYSWMRWGQKGQMGEMVYDSSKKDTPVPPIMQGFAALIGEGFSLKVTPKGQVKAVRGLKRVRENISKKLPAGRMREFMMKSMEQYLSDEAVKQFNESWMAMYPDKPVGVGDSWSKKVVLSQGFPMVLESKWTLKGRKKGVAIIEVSSIIKTDPKAKPMEMGAHKVSYEFSGKQQGVLEMQESTGLVIRSKINQEMSGQTKMDVTAPGAKPQTMTTPMKIKGVVTMEMGKWRKGVWLEKIDD